MQVTKGERGVITVAGAEVEVFMLPDGSYRYSQASASKAIGLGRNDLNMYIERTNPSAGEGALTIQVKSARVKGLTDVAISQYWQWKAGNGNKQALALVTALNTEALQRRADTLYNITKSEVSYETQTAQLRTELLQQTVAEFDWVPSKRQLSSADTRGSWNVITIPEDCSDDEAEVLQDAGYLKWAYGSGYAPLLPNIVSAAEQRLSSRGYRVIEGQLRSV